VFDYNSVVIAEREFVLALRIVNPRDCHNCMYNPTSMRLRIIKTRGFLGQSVLVSQYVKYFLALSPCSYILFNKSGVWFLSASLTRDSSHLSSANLSTDSKISLIVQLANVLQNV